MKSPKLFCLIAVFFMITFNSCGFVIKSYINKDTENIPPDFGKEKTTLLVIQKPKSYKKKVEKIIQQHYTGNYIIVTREELDDKYKDPATYRYILDDDISISKMYLVTITKDLSTGFETKTKEPLSSASRSFHILDRQTKKIHDTGVSSGTSWKKILKVYLEKLDSERIKNGGK